MGQRASSPLVRTYHYLPFDTYTEVNVGNTNNTAATCRCTMQQLDWTARLPEELLEACLAGCPR